jgi:hypothetical protein
MFGQTGARTDYLKVAEGVFKHKNKAGETDTGQYYDGKIVAIARRPAEYEGNVWEEVLVTMEDATDEKMPRVQIQFNLESWYSVTFFARLKAVLGAPRVRVGVYRSEKNEKISFAYMRLFGENGSPIKVEADKDFPRPKKVTVGTKELSDYGDVIKAADALIVQANAHGPSPAVDEADVPWVSPSAGTDHLRTAAPAPSGPRTTPPLTDDDLPF